MSEARQLNEDLRRQAASSPIIAGLVKSAPLTGMWAAGKMHTIWPAARRGPYLGTGQAGCVPGKAHRHGIAAVTPVYTAFRVPATWAPGLAPSNLPDRLSSSRTDSGRSASTCGSHPSQRHRPRAALTRRRRQQTIPKAYYQAERKLRWQRAQARRSRGSRGWWEAQHKINRLHRRITGLRRNAQHQMTSELVHKFQNLVIEDLNVAGMMHGRTSQGPGTPGNDRSPTRAPGITARSA